MKKTIVTCLLVTGMLIFASVAFVAGSPRGVPSTPPDLNESAATVRPVLVASFNCGDGACDDGDSCCDSYNACCPPGMNILCPNSGTCYSSMGDAQADCGWDYDICWVPAD
jgi:hypothetical protein